MARTAIAATQITLAGITLNVAGGTAADVANGNYISGFDNDGRHLFVLANNTGGSTYTVTFVTPGTSSGGYTIGDEVKSLLAGDIKLYGPFPLADFSKQLQIDAQNAAVKLSAFWI